MGFKPMFEEERLFFKEKTGIDLPTECWRNGSKIYLDFTQPKALIEFKVADGEIIISKDRSNDYKVGKNIEFLPKQKKIEELINENKDRLNIQANSSIVSCINMINKYPNYFYLLSHSGGKDSTITYWVWTEALKQILKEPNWIINFANTSNDTADTYRFIKQLPKDKLNTLNPSIGWTRWITEIKKYFIPSTRVRNCCSTYKEGQVNKAYDNERDTINITGLRSKESVKRQDYEMIMDYDWRINHFKNNNVPKKWITFAPIIEWTDEDVWLFLLYKNIEFNRMYKFGFHRVGCLICPFQQDYIDLLIKEYYPKRWEWWSNMLKKNYEITCVEKNLKWTLKEWCNGKWKRAVSKEYELINASPTKERVKQLADLKGVSEDMAKKYFKKKCYECGKNLNPTELAMFYKLNGRFENTEDDNRHLLCKKCFCKNSDIKIKDYEAMARNFRDDGCKLF